MEISLPLRRTFQTGSLFAIVLVMASHYRSAFIGDSGEIPGLNYYLQEFLINGASGIAVPFFAFISGLFFFRDYCGWSSFQSKIRIRFFTLFIPYVLTSSCFFVIHVLRNRVLDPLFSPGMAYTVERVLLHPVSEQMWFLRDLTVLILISPVIFVLVKNMKLFFLFPLFLLWLFEIQIFPKIAGIYLINMRTLFFFCLGCYCTTFLEYLEKIPVMEKKYTSFLFIAWVILVGTRMYIEPVFIRGVTVSLVSTALYNLAVILGVVLLIFFSSMLKSRRLIFLSGFTFFVYLFHYYPVNYCVWLISSFLVPNAYNFYIAFPVVVVSVFFAAYVCERFFQPVYTVLTGKRGSQAALQRSTESGQ